MRKKDLALRVLSTAAIMSIVSSIAASAFAGVYYIGNDNADLTITANENGTVTVKHGDKTYEEDGNEEIVIKGEKGSDAPQDKGTTQNETTTIGESSVIENEPTDVGDVDETFGVEEEPTDDAEQSTEKECADSTDAESDDTTEEAGASDTEKPVTEEGEDAEETLPDTLPEDEADGADAIVNEQEPVSEEELEKPTTNPTAQETPAEETAQQETPAPAAKAAEAVAKQSDGDDDTTTNAPVSNVIKVVNNWKDNVVDGVKKILNIRLDNVNIKSKTDAAMTVSGDGDTKIELDGKNTLDSSGATDKAGLNKAGNGSMTITADTADSDKLIAKGGAGAAGIGANIGGVANITIEGNATVEAEGGADYKSTSPGDNYATRFGGAGIGGSGRHGTYGNADNITIRGNAKVTAKSNSTWAAAIGGGYCGSGTNIGISGNAKVEAEGVATDIYGHGAAVIGSGYSNNGIVNASVTIGTEGADSETEHTEVAIKTGGSVGIGGVANNKFYPGKTTVTIQGGATVDCQGEQNIAIGGVSGESTIEVKDDAHIKNAKGIIGGKGEFDVNNNRVNGTVSVIVKDNAQIDKVGRIGGEYANQSNVTIEGNAKIGEVESIGSYNVAHSYVKVLQNAVIEKLTGILGQYANGSGVKVVEVTVNGDEEGKVKINENNPGNGYIKGGTLTIGDNVLIKLRADNNSAKPAADIDDSTLKTNIKNNKSAEIWYTNTSGTLYKIIHSEDLCEKSSTKNITKQPTCTEPGSASYTCDYEHTNGATDPSCNRTWTGEVPATGHDYGEWTVTKPATCKEEGVETRTCKNDSSHTETRKIAKTENHQWSDWTVKTPATCEGKGVEHRTCSVCQKEDTRETPALDHLWKEDHRTGNCGVAGDIYYVCERDSSHTKTEHVDATGNHQFNDWHQTKAPSCQEEGEEQRECGVCGKTETRPVDKLPHKEVVDQSTVKEPTCEEPGYTGDIICGEGGEFIRPGEVIPATGHDWTDWTPDGKGNLVHECTKCGKTESKPDPNYKPDQPANPDDNNTPVVQDGDHVTAPELDVLSEYGVHQFFTVSQSGGVRTYTSQYDCGTLTGAMSTLEYLQEEGTDTIVFTTNQRTSRFAVADLLALVNEGDTFYLRHTNADEPTLLVIESDHSEVLGN